MIELLKIIGTLAAVFFGAYLSSYFKQKGKDSAYKSSKAEITSLVEGVKKEFKDKSDQLKSHLTLIVNKQSKLHDIRIEIIRELHMKLCNLEVAFQGMSGFRPNPEGKTHEEIIREINEACSISFNDFQRYYYLNSIFLPDSFRTKVEQITNEYSEAYFDINEPVYHKQMGITLQDDPAIFKAAHDKRSAALKAIRKEIPELNKHLRGLAEQILNGEI